jgi:hypothetical protein
LKCTKLPFFRVKEQKSLVWTLLDKQKEKPNSKWSIWNDVKLEVKRENQLKEKTARGCGSKASKDVPKIFDRMLKLVQEFKECGGDEKALLDLKDKYDEFGIAIY